MKDRLKFSYTTFYVKCKPIFVVYLPSLFVNMVLAHSSVMHIIRGS